MDKIDIVVPWVDGSDPEWRKSKAKYSGKAAHGAEEIRFREWDQLRYFFRGIEQHAPWVYQIHFITCGHLPSWLNTNHPKLHIVRHDEYIPSEYLPTFSSHPIELNLHRIEGLSEKFIYLNDDYFIINDVAPSDFFKGNDPSGVAGLSIIGEVGPEFAGILYQDYCLINRNFNSWDTIRKHFPKFVNLKYGMKRNFQTLALMPYCTQFFPGFYNGHGPSSFLKSTLSEVWEKEGKKLDETCRHRFRSPDDVNQYVFLWWQWCKGQIAPADNRKLFKYITVATDDETIIRTLRSDIPIVIINDGNNVDFEAKKALINGTFDQILGTKSSFEL